ncbi:MAG: NAD(P)/FAD-dependent oxidoreductase [Erysipelotrichales bacterium]|nr:NAD(P)/FAD-dependent oxidoreductase [Erysipelotrichales bacterium]
MFDIIIIGGGPVGLNAALEFSKDKRILLIESEEFLGGQITKLYPEKEIVDIEDIPSIIAKDYINDLVDKCKNNPNITIKLKEKAVSLKPLNDTIDLATSESTYQAKYIIIAVGLGTSSPRPMGLENENKCSNILYSLQDLYSLENKNVLVLGGGDSALDWTKEISKISEYVTIIHRRKEFRGNFDTIKDIENVIVKTPYIPIKINMCGDLLESLVIRNVETNNEETLNADFVFVNYGNIPLVNTFGLETINNGIVTNEFYQTNLKNVFAIGDVARYENKKYRIQPALNEIKKLKEIIK